MKNDLAPSTGYRRGGKPFGYITIQREVVPHNIRRYANYTRLDTSVGIYNTILH